jgi:small subunit ribosomal protein S8
MFSDPIADMLTRIRNALRAGHMEVNIPKSKLKLEIAKILLRQGYIAGVQSNEEERSFTVVLKYDNQGEPVIRTIKRISRSGLRVYSKRDKLPRVLSGAGTAIVSTSKGLLTDHEARKQGVGGEVLCYVY